MQMSQSMTQHSEFDGIGQKTSQHWPDRVNSSTRNVFQMATALAGAEAYVVVRQTDGAMQDDRQTDKPSSIQHSP